MTDESITVRRNDDASRYEIFIDETRVGFAAFKPEDGKLVFPQVEIDPEYGGRGLGGTLVGEALTDVARRGETVVPVCPFVVAYIAKNETPGLTVESAKS